MTDAQKKVERNLRLLIVYTICANGLFILPVIVPYYRDEIGLGFREFMIGEAAFSTLMILMEVPTGWISDVWGRRKTLMASAAAQVAGWSLLLYADSFLTAVMAQAALAVAVSLFSGTNSAMLYDSLLEAGREDEYRRLEGRRLGLGLYSIGIASMLGGFMYQVHHMLPLVATIISMMVGFVVTFLMKEPSWHRQAVHKNPFADMAVTFRYALRGHPEVGGIILLSAILFASTKMLMWAQQPYYMALGIPEGWFGALAACGFLLGGTASAIGHRLDGRFSNVGVLRTLLIWAVLAAAGAGVWSGAHGVVLLMSGSFIFGIGWSRVQAAINKRVVSGRRATILSCASLMVHMFSIPLLVLTGTMQEWQGIGASLMLLAFLLLTVGGTASLLLKKRSAPVVPGH
ncbi:MAG TPA: MFS transporter, partial [Alphaproteobacteria bacterium]|jgi:MFS family permease